jgi:hypothetical protein
MDTSGEARKIVERMTAQWIDWFRNPLGYPLNHCDIS